MKKLNHFYRYNDIIIQVFKQPWPGIMRTVYRNHQRFETTYFKKFPGYYVTGDGNVNTSTCPELTGWFIH